MKLSSAPDRSRAEDPPACAMAALVEARRDGRLGEREVASLTRHLSTCASCRELERELDEVRVLLRRAPCPPVLPLDHQRNRMALLRAAALPPARPERGARAWSTALLAVAVLGAAIAAPAAVVARRRPHSAPLAQHLRLSALRSPLAAASTTVETSVHGSAEARFERRVEGLLERVSLSEGTLDLHVRKLASEERFVVATADAEVEVRGTTFEVEAHAGHLVHVAVSEGKVEVRYRGAVSVIAAGGAWQSPVETVAMTVAAGEEARPVRGPVRLASVAPATPVSRASAASAAPAAAADGKGDDASRAFGDAVDLLGRGDYGAARRQLDAFRAAHPTDGRADLAAFLTIVSLQNAGRRAEAQEAARRYLALYPNGDRRAEAASIARVASTASTASTVSATTAAPR